MSACNPFGRFDKPAVQMGAEAIRLALKDAGVEWKDIQFGFGGSYEVPTRTRSPGWSV